jgi:hypothetical protein
MATVTVDIIHEGRVVCKVNYLADGKDVTTEMGNKRPSDIAIGDRIRMPGGGYATAGAVWHSVNNPRPRP